MLPHLQCVEGQMLRSVLAFFLYLIQNITYHTAVIFDDVCCAEVRELCVDFVQHLQVEL